MGTRLNSGICRLEMGNANSSMIIYIGYWTIFILLGLKILAIKSYKKFLKGWHPVRCDYIWNRVLTIYILGFSLEI